MNPEQTQEAKAAELCISDKRRNFGASLRAIREEGGLTEKDLIHSTRISPPFIRALEEGELDRLPGQVFGRGFVKNICKALGVDSVELVKAFNSCYEETRAQEKPSLARRMIGPLGPVPLGKRWLKKNARLLAVASVSLAAVAVFWYSGGQSKKVAKAPAPPAAVQTTAKEKTPPPPPTPPPEADDRLDASELALELPLTEPPALPQAPLAKDPVLETAKTVPAIQLTRQPGRHLLVLEVLEPLAVELTIDEGVKTVQTLPKGKHALEFKEKLDLFIQKGDQVKLQFNEYSLGIASENGGPRRYSFKSKLADKVF